MSGHVSDMIGGMATYINTVQGDGTTLAPNHAGGTGVTKILVGTGASSIIGSHVGTATLVAGTKTVADTSITASSKIFISTSALGTVAAPKFITVTRSVGVSFTLTSTDGTDTSKIDYMVVN